jgi:hypothetical protein
MKIFLPLLMALCMTSIAHGQAIDSTSAHKKSWHDYGNKDYSPKTKFLELETVKSNKKKKWKMENDVCVNTTFFIKQVINLSGTSLEISPYIVGYNFFPVKSHGLRVAVGGSFTHSNTNPDSTFVQISKTSEVDYRVGYEYRYFFGKYWTFFTGVDFTNSFIVNYTKVNSSTDIISTSNNTWSVGGGPMIGIQANIGKHISLFTETAFYYKYASTRNKTSSLNFPDLNVNQISDIEQTGSFLLPTSLFFVFRF